MREKDLQAFMAKYLRQDNIKHTSVFEYKIIKHPKKSLNLISDFQPQQIPMLLKAENSALYKKLSDLDPTLKPFDAVLIVKAPAYVVALYYTPRKKNRVYFLRVGRLKAEIDNNNFLLDELKAESLAERVISYGAEKKRRGLTNSVCMV